MKAILELCKTPDGMLEIFGKENEKEQYTGTITQYKGLFPYLDTITINLILQIDSLENVIATTYLICDHKLVTIDEVDYDDLDVTRFKFPQDGLYKVSHIILPKKSWVTKFAENFIYSPSILYDLVVYYDEGLIYIQDELEGDLLITLDELFEVNVLENMSYVKEEVFTFSTVDLHNCLYKINKQLLHEYCPLNCEKHADSDLIWKRDLIRMALYVIKYELEFKLYFKAQKTLEDITGCTPFCDTINHKNKHLGCGCHTKA